MILVFFLRAFESLDEFSLPLKSTNLNEYDKEVVCPYLPFSSLYWFLVRSSRKKNKQILAKDQEYFFTSKFCQNFFNRLD